MSANPAEVAKLLSALIATSSPSTDAVETGAQKWDRVPFSLNASVPSDRPEAISANRFGIPAGGAAATATAADTCMR